MTEEKIKALVAKLRKLVPARGEWTTLAEHACSDAADALESMLVKSEMTDEQKIAALQERALELTVEYAPKHEYRDPDSGNQCFSALGFARDLVQAISQETVEVTHCDRTVTIYADSVLRVWGPDIEEMSNAPRSLQTVQDALDWLYNEEPEKREKPTPIEELMDEYRADGSDFDNIEWVKLAALRYVDTMRDSQVRALLYALATDKTEQEPNAWRDPTNGDPGQSVTFQKCVADKWPHIYSMSLYATPQAAKCPDCSNTGYVPDGNHCMACSVPADPNIEGIFQRQQAGFERCYEALGITDDRERSWSSLVLAVGDIVAFEKSSAAAYAKLQRDYTALKELCSRSETAAAEAQTELKRLARAYQPSEPVATLHDDGYFTWHGAKPEGFHYAGWRMSVYSAPQPAKTGEPVAWVSDYALRCLKGNADATCSPQGMREFDQNIPLYEHIFALTENQRTALEAAIRILANGEHNSKYSEYLKPLLDAPAKEVPVKASPKKRLTDVQIKEAVDAIDFGTMVTADDFIYVIARAVLDAENGSTEEIEPEVIDQYWKYYQEGRGSADHTDKEVFMQTLELFAKGMKENQ
jgi:hypothetical protein